MSAASSHKKNSVGSEHFFEAIILFGSSSLKLKANGIKFYTFI